MKLAILCLCLASASAAPSPFHYTPHFAGPRQQAKPLPFSAGQPLPQPPMTGAYSVELIYPSFPAGTAGTNGGLPFPAYGFLKYSIPQPPGRQSVEVVSAFLFSYTQFCKNSLLIIFLC
ncbi:secretory calcium-binding phosphoprotein 5 [Betta splendens]|uniref:Secretory calcium-binding phosphoprotein 5 n=1 Tax=Betta splendens TaxID=158456 RepID=A0A8M1HA88_BETSP|nr:secretory calcium-binding phosphoprotein 5 [Betta splendens]